MIPLHEPTFDKSDEDIIIESIRSTWVSTGGPFVNQFEKDFAKYLGIKYAVSVSNGTVGLQIAIEAMKKIKNIDNPFDVITPSLTFIATANSIVHAGGNPVFVDTMKNSLQICPLAIEEIINKNYYRKNDKLYNKITGNILFLIIPVHIMGWKSPIEQLKSISEKYNLEIIEDAAEALGSYHLNDTHIGLDGSASVFSFNGNKILTTGGGGMICTNNENIAKRAKHLSTTSKTDNLRFIHDEVGYNHRMVNLLAALGCSQLKKLPLYISRKKEIFELYKYHLSNKKTQIYQQENTKSNNWLINVVFENKEIKENVLNCLLENNIQARPLWTPCHLQPAYSNLIEAFKPDSFLNTLEIWEKTLSLPSSPNLKNEKIYEISKIILEIVNKKGFN